MRIAPMEGNHPHLTTQKTGYVEICRARHWAELVMDNRDRFRDWLEGASGSSLLVYSTYPSASGCSSARGCRSPLTECRLTFFVPLFVELSTSCSRIELQIRERCWCRVPHGYRFVSNPSASLRSSSNGISAREAVNA